MSQEDCVFNNILVGVDGRPGGRDAISLARELAAPAARITLLHVCGAVWLPGKTGALAMPAEVADAERMLEHERAAASLSAELCTEFGGSVGRVLHQVAERQGNDLIVVGSCRHGLLGRVMLGDDARASLNGAPCAVAVAPRGRASEPGSLAVVGIGYDGSPESEDALAIARGLAALHGASIRALSVVSLQDIPPGKPIPDDWPEVVKRLMDDRTALLNELDGVQGEVTYGEPADELAHLSRELGLLIVGSRGFGPVDRLFNGSTSNYLLHRAMCPLIVVPRGARLVAGADQAEGDAAVNRIPAASSK